jgi:hypothetical protein
VQADGTTSPAWAARQGASFAGIDELETIVRIVGVERPARDTQRGLVTDVAEDARR